MSSEKRLEIVKFFDERLGFYGDLTIALAVTAVKFGVSKEDMLTLAGFDTNVY